MMKRLLVLFFSLSIFSITSHATHIVGGSLSYTHLGGSTYRVTMKLYRDCGGINFPGSVTISVRQPNGAVFSPSKDITIPFPGATQLQPYIDTCAVNPGICVQEAIFTTVVNNLPPNPGGYHLYYQLCCRNASLLNIVNPLSTGESFYAFIPDNNIYFTNSSPQWVNFPPIFVCQNQPINFNHAATDIDGDSLSYHLYQPYSNTAPTYTGNNINFTPVTWQTGYGTTNPLGGPPNSMTISNTGLLNDSPQNLGQYVVGVCCVEWRNGVRLDSILRDFQFNVVYCPPIAQANFTYSGSCNSSTVCFTNTTTPPANTYLWDFGDGSPTSTATSPCHTYGGLGPYTVTLISNQGTPCADTSTQQVVISFITAAFTASNDTVCAGQPVQFTDQSTTSINTTVTAWSWSFPGGSPPASNAQNPIVIYNSQGNYTVTLTATSGAGCTASQTLALTVLGGPKAIAGNDTNSCTNNPCMGLVGSVQNAGGGMWIGAGTFNPNNTTLNATYCPTATELSNGFATLVLVTTGNGICSADTDTLTINYVPGPTASAGPDIFVCKDTSGVPLNGAVTIASGGMWTTSGCGTFSPNANTLNATYIPCSADTAAGTVTLILTTTGNGNCNPASDTVLITFTATPTVSITVQDTSCKSQPIPISASSGTGQGVWSTSGTGTFNPNNTTLNGFYQPSAADDNNGFVWLYFNTTNNGGCKSQRDSIKVILIPAPAGAFSYVSACPNSPVSFTDNSTTTGFITSWTWDFGDSSPTNNLQNPTHVYTTGGNYTVTLVVTSNNGCQSTVTQLVNVYYTPVAAFLAPSVCKNSLTTFTDQSTVTGGTITTWTWTFGDGSPNSTLQNPSHTYVNAGNYTVTLTVTSNQGCTASVSQQITVQPGPTAQFSENPTVAVIGQTVQFTDQSFTGIVSWLWHFGDGDSSMVQNPTHIYNAGGIYTVILVVTDAFGCSDTITEIVIISMPPNVPTGFSPNGDGQNDILFVKGGPYKELEFRIYNNWGELIFISHNQKDGWDGTKEGVKQPLGVYVWTVNAVTEDNLSHELKGDVTLLR